MQKKTPPKPRSVNHAAVLFGRRVRHFRHKAELSLRQLERKAGINYVSLIDIEHGRTVPTLVTALKIAEALNFEFDDLKASV